MSEQVHVVTDLPKENKSMKKKFITAAIATAAVAAVALVAKRNANSSSDSLEVVTETQSA